MTNPEVPEGSLPRSRRKTIPATCGLHRGPIGFTNLMVSKRDGTIVLDPHVDGSCVIYLDEEGARKTPRHPDRVAGLRKKNNHTTRPRSGT
jgi:hypothetical protein